MRTFGTIAAILAVALFLSGCGGGPDPDEPVRITVEASPQLNTYDGAPHPVDVYIYKIDDPSAFEASDLNRLLQEGQPVAGGYAIERRNISPGATAVWNIGATKLESYTHIGVVATFKEPQGAQRMTHQWEENLKLRLDPRSILSFAENDD